LPKTPRPFWLPASSFYFLAAAVAMAFFFFVWGVLHDGDEPMPYVPAGIGASVVLAGAVFLREIVLRNARDRYLLTQKRLDYNLKTVTQRPPPPASEAKLTIERNAEIIRQIQKKSDAAKVLMKLSEGHSEVAEICAEYLRINKKALETIGAGSPRLAALMRGKQLIGALHKYHLLAWAEIESRNLTQDAKNRVTMLEKTETAQKALNVLNAALVSYPQERRLIESEEAVREYIVSIKVAHWIEEAERAAFKGNHKRAVSLYQDALFFIAREEVKSQEFQQIAEKINGEIDRLREYSPNSELLETPDNEREND
jgi:hypothetical protein